MPTLTRFVTNFKRTANSTYSTTAPAVGIFYLTQTWNYYYLLQPTRIRTPPQDMLSWCRSPLESGNASSKDLPVLLPNSIATSPLTDVDITLLSPLIIESMTAVDRCRVLSSSPPKIAFWRPSHSSAHTRQAPIEG